MVKFKHEKAEENLELADHEFRAGERQCSIEELEKLEAQGRITAPRDVRSDNSGDLREADEEGDE